MPLNVWSIIEQGRVWCPKGQPLSPWRIVHVGPRGAGVYDIKHRGQLIETAKSYRDAKARASYLMSIWIV